MQSNGIWIAWCWAMLNHHSILGSFVSVSPVLIYLVVPQLRRQGVYICVRVNGSLGVVRAGYTRFLSWFGFKNAYMYSRIVVMTKNDFKVSIYVCLFFRWQLFFPFGSIWYDYTDFGNDNYSALSIVAKCALVKVGAGSGPDVAISILIGRLMIKEILPES